MTATTLTTIFKISVPLKVFLNKVERGKFFDLNLNKYRNTHYQQLNKAKARFSEKVAPRVKRLCPKLTRPIKITYVLHRTNKHVYDVGNVACIVDKFFTDCLPKAKVLKDDNFNYVPNVEFIHGRCDAPNAYCEIYVQELIEHKDYYGITRKYHHFVR